MPRGWISQQRVFSQLLFVCSPLQALQLLEIRDRNPAAFNHSHVSVLIDIVRGKITQEVILKYGIMIILQDKEKKTVFMQKKMFVFTRGGLILCFANNDTVSRHQHNVL